MNSQYYIIMHIINIAIRDYKVNKDKIHFIPTDFISIDCIY